MSRPAYPQAGPGAKQAAKQAEALGAGAAADQPDGPPPGVPDHLPPPLLLPGDAERLFERDLVHFPHQVPTLDFDFIRFTVEPGSRAAVSAHAAPLKFLYRRFWTHLYSFDVYYAEPSKLGEIWRTTARATYAPLLADLEAHWETVWLPELRVHQDYWFSYDLRGASTGALVAHFDETLRRLERIWEIHFEIVYAVDHAWEMFLELHSELFEGSSRLATVVMLQGIDNLTTAAGRGIWKLREAAAATPALSRLISQTPAGEVLAALAATPAAAPFLERLNAYLGEFGRRPTQMGLSVKTLLEDPTPVIRQLQDALAQPESDPERHRAQRLAERELAINQAKAALAHYPRPLQAEFARRLAVAQAATRLKEDHNFIIDFECTAAVRWVLLEIANRLVAASRLAAAEEMIHLTLDELRQAAAALAGDEPPARLPDLRELVSSRQAEMAHYADVAVPAKFGNPPAPPNKYGGAPAPATGPDPAATPEAPEPGVFKGEGVSAGRARGRVRLARNFAEAKALLPGEVLVAPFTSQPWTPLFATAAALVTEVGGVLSHAGVVAREYRLPTVSGITGATTLLATGMLVEVDGAAGVVRVLAES